MFYQVLLRLFPVCFPDFIRQIARYPPHKIRKTSSKVHDGKRRRLHAPS